MKKALNQTVINQISTLKKMIQHELTAFTTETQPWINVRKFIPIGNRMCQD